MATLVIDRGVYSIRWQENKSRKTISLPGKKFAERTAKEMVRIVEKLLYYRENPSEVPDKTTMAWLKGASPIIQGKLALADLIEIPQRHTTEELWSEFLKAKRDIKDSTRESYANVERRFFAFFDSKTDLSELAKEHIEDWNVYLQTDYESPVNGLPLVEATVAGTISRAKTVFNWAKSKKWISKSPLDGVGRGSFVNEDNEQFVPMADYYRLLEACPCLDWRCIIALARIGELRCPLEVLRLRWTDVNWEKSRFYVRSSKTEHHEGKEGRLVPLFPRLREELQVLFESELSEGSEFVITRYRDPERTNLGTQFGRIVQMAGVEPFKKPFTNMRGSRSTEIYSAFGAFLESKWIGPVWRRTTICRSGRSTSSWRFRTNGRMVRRKVMLPAVFL